MKELVNGPKWMALDQRWIGCGAIKRITCDLFHAFPGLLRQLSAIRSPDDCQKLSLKDAIIEDCSSLKSDFAAGKKNPGPRGPGSPPSPCPRAQPRVQPRLDRRVIAVWQTRHGIGSARAARTLPTADCHPWPDPFGSSQVVVAGAAGQRSPRHTYRRRPVSMARADSSRARTARRGRPGPN